MRARAQRQIYPRFSYLGNYLTVGPEIWCVVWDQLARRFTHVKGGVLPRVRTCVATHFHVWGPAGQIGI